MQKMLLSLGPLFFMPRNVRQFHGYPLRQAKYSMVNLKIILEESLRGNDHYMPAPCLLVSADPVLFVSVFASPRRNSGHLPTQSVDIVVPARQPQARHQQVSCPDLPRGTTPLLINFMEQVVEPAGLSQLA